ncbi:MAG: diguanylate cyclase [Clostridiales bacterium]|nr:diguanylate cyclase [Clostridiales bacterium]
MDRTNNINWTKKSYVDFFNNIVLKYLQCSFKRIDYRSVADDLMFLSGAKYVIVNEYCKEENIMQTKAIAGLGKQYKKIMPILGFNPIEKKWNVDDESKRIIETRKLHKLNSLSEVISGQISQKTIVILEKTFGVGYVYSIGLYQKNEILGSLIIYTEKGKELEEQDLVEFFAHLLGTIYLRQKAEERLYKKEIELQEVNNELTATNEKLQASMRQLLATEEKLREKYGELRIKEKELFESDKRWEFALEAAEAGIWDWNIKTGYVYHSDKLLHMFGFSREDEEFFSKRENRVHALDIRRTTKKLNQHIAGLTPLFEAVHRIKCKTGGHKWTLNRGKVISWDDAGNPTRMIGLYIDYEEQKKIQNELTIQKKTMESFFEYSPDAVAYLDQTFHIISVNSKFVELFGYSKKECKNKFIDKIVCSPEQEELATQINKNAEQNLHINIETQRTNKNGVAFPVLVRGGPTIVDGEIIGYHAIYTDISEQKRIENHIRRLSYQDALTKLSNRAFFEEQLLELNTIEMHPLSVIMADVNSLKLVNDVFGHNEGDKLLIIFANILKKQCRKDDIIARWGGDEFAIILPKTSEKIAKKICNRIKKACSMNGVLPINVSVALGYAKKNNVEIDFSNIIKIAEKKMYREKLIESKAVRDRIIALLQDSLIEKNIETKEHTNRMRELGKRLGKRLRLSRVEYSKLDFLALLHDIGKIVISDNILLKPEKLTANEWEEIKKHPEAGYRIVQSTADSSHIAELILSHHEHWDGRGYPRGLKGTRIPRLARIIAIIDAYDVMTNGAVYKKAISKEEALEEIRRFAGSQFDPKIASIFLEMMME